MSQPSSFTVRHAALIFALKTFAAAMLAFYIALLLDMPRPYWAMTSVYVTSSMLTGATSSKAVYRILGTLIGAAGAIVLVPNLLDAPELLSLVIALWVGAFLYVALLDGTPRSYVFMLAGYTIAIVGFPVLSTPELTFDVAVSRVQEITLGIICASVVSITRAASERRLRRRGSGGHLACRCGPALRKCPDRGQRRSGARQRTHAPCRFSVRN